MKITFKGIVQAVTPVVKRTGTNGGKDFSMQSLIVTIPGYVDAFGDKKGLDENWEVQLFNDAIEKHKLDGIALDGKKIEVVAYLNSKTYKKDGADAYQLQLRLAEFKTF